MIDLIKYKDTQITTFGPVDQRSLQQLKNCLDDDVEAPYAVLCADHHPGYSQPIGAAIGYINQISPSGVGYDIGCGNLAVRTNLLYSEIAEAVPAIMGEIVKRISFGIGQKNNEPVDHPVLEMIANANFIPQRSLLELARTQLGTVGSGNHYIDLFVDTSGYAWIGVHFGSRGFGHKTASGFLALAQGKKFDERGAEGEMDSPPILFNTNSYIGEEYIEAMRLAGMYAWAGRESVVDRVLAILDAQMVEEVHNYHNFAWPEKHFGQDLWVVRKGCTPAFPRQQGFVGSTMGDRSVILEGIDTPESQNALYSTVHGAGRIMSRRQAAGKQKWVNGSKVTVKAGLVDYNKVLQEMYDKSIVIRGGGADEAPEVYKKLDEVISYHESTIAVNELLTPIGVAMAGAGEHDPYKD